MIVHLSLQLLQLLFESVNFLLSKGNTKSGAKPANKVFSLEDRIIYTVKLYIMLFLH